MVVASEIFMISNRKLLLDKFSNFMLVRRHTTCRVGVKVAKVLKDFYLKKKKKKKKSPLRSSLYSQAIVEAESEDITNEENI